MLFFRSLALLLVVVGLASAADLAKYRQDGYFGKETLKDGQAIPQDNPEVRPFNISIPDSELAYLKERLANARFVDHLPGTEFHYGMSSDELKKVVSYWNSTYDWRKQEAWLNQYPQFKTQIEGLDVHFVHVKASPKAKTVIPLMTVHGWPSTFMEVYKAIQSLTEPDADGVAYEVIAPSIPAHGYSEASHKAGLDHTNIARIFHKLQQRLGFEKMLLQGNDWGNIITRAMTILYPESAIGIHVLGPFDALEDLLSMERIARIFLTPHLPSLSLSDIKEEFGKIFPLKETLVNAIEETGILHYSATKPDTIASALIDSPVGMAAHILDKYCTFVNREYMDFEDGGITKKFTMDELLNVVMIYWTSGNIAGTARLYKELLRVNSGVNNEKITVPAGVVDAKYDALRSPKATVEGNYAQLLQFVNLPTGGHLMFFEEPQLIVGHLRSLTKKILNKPSGIGGIIGGIGDKIKDVIG